jgi:hypothetical protein
MRPSISLLAVIVALLAAAPRAAAYERSNELERVASVFALRAAEVRCPSTDEWVADPIWGDPTQTRAWAYTDMIHEHIVMHPALCAGAAAVNDATLPLWQRATGALVLVHEAYHLRRWGGRWDEGRVECRAIRHFRVGAELLGDARRRERAAPVRARGSPAHGHAVRELPGSELPAPAVGASDVAVEHEVRIALGPTPTS